jgi:chromosome segregation ATPase
LDPISLPLSNLEDAIMDKEKQIHQLRDQRDRAESEKQEERELHEREVAEYKLKVHSMEAELEKLSVRLERAVAEKVRYLVTISCSHD